MKRLSFLKRLSAARTAKQERRRVLQRNRMLRMENLDSRMVMDGAAPTWTTTIGTQTVLAGAPLVIALNASDTDSGPLTFSKVSVSDESKLTIETPSNNPTLKLVVAGYGEMWFELFRDKAPAAVARIEEIVNAGDWDNTIFHRLIAGFMVQGGGRYANPPGGNVTGYAAFDDQFHVDLMHTSSGLLSMAKTAADDSNTTEIFITDVPTRSLDFNHMVFGKLVKGDDVRVAIMNVDRPGGTGVTAGDVPNIPIVITSAAIFNDDDNGVLFLKAPEGKTGPVTVKVRVTDSDGNSSDQEFTVNIQTDTDTYANSQPFLNVIPPVFVNPGNNATFQLGSTDIENSQVFYYAMRPTDATVPFTVTQQNGLVTVTPQAGFVGTFKVKVGVSSKQNANSFADPFAPLVPDAIDTQFVTINVRPTSPTLILDSTTDSGVSQTDGITSAENLKFNVGGVTNAAIINLYRGNDLIETVTATGTTATITTTKFNSFADGVYNMRVTQKVNGIESEAGNFQLTLDNTGPAQVNPAPPTEAIATKPYAYDAQSPEEGQPGLRYSLANAPAGMTIDPATGVVTWTPTVAQVGTQTFGVIATDAAGNASVPRTATVSVADAPLVQLILKITDANGNVINSIANGQTFELRVFTKDQSPTSPNGVFSAYMDIEWLAEFADITGISTFGPAYAQGDPNTHEGGGAVQGTRSAGLIDEIGTLQGLTFTNSAGELLLFKQTFTAKKSGVITFSANESENPSNETTLNPPNHNVQVPNSRIDFGDVQLTIDPTVSAVDDTFNVDEDSENQTLNPISNDNVTVGTRDDLIITAVGAVSQSGGSAVGVVTIAPGGKTLIFTPRDDFFGEATFTYTVKNTDNSTDVGEIKVQVQPKNDNPTAVADSDTIAINAPEGEFIDVLDNDLFAPDAEEELEVTGFLVQPQHGTVTIAPGGAGVLYKPAANYTGSDSFTYEITDPGGLKSSAVVTITVANVDAIPIALPDAKTVDEDSAATNIDVLANDSAGTADPTNTLEVTAVTTTSTQGTVTISADKKTVNYTPKPNFFGTDTFTYTMKDASGATKQGTVTVTVENKNDAPDAVDDEFTVGKDQTKTLDLLANDKSEPDPAETFTIEEITLKSEGVTIEISSDKKTVTYKPKAGFTGDDTFKYKIKDAGGLMSEATVKVTVLNFVPGKISGRVFFDKNGDGLRQGAEIGLANITIKLEGTSEFETAAISKTLVTDSQGRYTFEALPPGNYTITQVTMNGLTNTRYHAGTNGGSVNGAALKVTLAENVESMYNDFIYDAPRQVGILATSLFASSSRSGFVAAASAGASGHVWNSIGQGWANYSNLKLNLASDLKSVTITGTDGGASTAAAAAKTATIQMTNAGRIRAIAKVGNTYTFQVNGTAAQIFGTSSGSGEAGSSNNRTAGAASGEANSANLSASDAALLAALNANSTERTENFVAKTRGLSQSARSADFLFASSAR